MQVLCLKWKILPFWVEEQMFKKYAALPTDNVKANILFEDAK